MKFLNTVFTISTKPFELLRFPGIGFEHKWNHHCRGCQTVLAWRTLSDQPSYRTPSSCIQFPHSTICTLPAPHHTPKAKDPYDASMSIDFCLRE